MPEIDITEVLLGSEIAGEAFIVQRRPEVVTSAGESIVPVPAQIQAYGSIQPTGENGLQREEDFDAQPKTISVVTPFRLRGVSQDQAGKNYKPDIVIWKGNNYVVQRVEDFSQYGAGWVSAECTSEDFVDQAPV